MAKQAVHGKARRSEKARRVQIKASDDESENAKGDRYHVPIVSSMNSDASSHAPDSVGTSDATESDEESSTCTSFETETDDSSVVELGVDTDDILDNEDLHEISSYDSRTGLVGGWFDFACGWMDRPYICAALGGERKQNSLLRESNLNTSKAIRTMKANQTLSLAARRAAIKDAKGIVNDQKLHRDVSRTVEVMATSVKKEEVQRQNGDREKVNERKAHTEPQRKSAEPSSHHESKKNVTDKSQAPMKTQTGKDAKLSRESAQLAEAQPTEAAQAMTRKGSTKKGESKKVPSKHTRSSAAIPDNAPAEEIRAKMNAVSAEAAEILKNNVEDKPSKPNDNEKRKASASRKAPSPKNSQNDLRRKVIDKVIKANEAESKSNETVAKEADTPKVEVSPAQKAQESSRRSSHRSTAIPELEEDKEPAEIVNVEALQMAEDDDIHSTSGPSPTTSKTTGKDNIEATKESQTTPEAENQITDLTHIDVDNDGLPAPPSLVQSRSSSPTKRSRLAAMKKSTIGRKDVEVIEVLELDDDDSWTPAERRDPTPSRSRRGSTNAFVMETSKGPSAMDNIRRDLSPSISSMRSSLFAVKPEQSEIKSQVINLWEQEEKKLNASRAHQVEKVARDEVFNDPLATETFAGLRRGRLETKENQQERKSRSKSSSRRLRSILPTSAAEEASVVSSMSKGGKRSKSLDMRRQPDIIDSDMALKKSRSRESRQHTDMSLELRRRLMASQAQQEKNTATEHWDSESRRSARSRNFVGVRTIDEAQRLRHSSNREYHEMTIHPSRSREQQSGEGRSKAIEASDRATRTAARQYIESRTWALHNESTTNRDVVEVETHSHSRSHHQRLQPRVERRPSLGREHDVYSSIPVTSPKGSEGGNSSNYEFLDAEDYSPGRRSNRNSSRGRDMRDDTEPRYSSNKRDPAGHTPIVVYGESRSKRRERTGSNGDSGHLKELRKLEKKITKQLMQVKQEQDQTPGWDERSAVSSKNLRKLEKRLVQTLRKEDEKRAAKLQRIRSKKPSRHSSASNMENSTPTHPQPTDEREDEQDEEPSSQPTKTMETSHEGRTKYGQLKVLRQSRPMHKYMQRSQSRSVHRQGGAPRPEAY